MKNIDKFNDFIYKVNAIMKSPVHVQWKKTVKEWKGSFKIENTLYEIFLTDFGAKEKHFSSEGHY